MKNIIINKFITITSIILLLSNYSAQAQVTKVEEVERDGKIWEVYSDGSWREKIYNKPVIEWINIPGGTFTMGSPESEAYREVDETQHQVRLTAFRMSKYEITFEQYDMFCEATKREKPSDEGWGRGKRPVINVSWYDAKEFADWMGCSLPSEAQWEYACRANNKAPFYTGVNLTSDQANYDGFYPYCSVVKGVFRNETTVVGRFAPNSRGLYDMHGNVWEWVGDCYDNYPIDLTIDPIIMVGSMKIIRGGSWSDQGHFCRSARRFQNFPDYKYKNVGFRLVAPVTTKKKK